MVCKLNGCWKKRYTVLDVQQQSGQVLFVKKTFSDLDAIGKPQSGLLLGNVGWLGSYSECTKSIVNAHYCLAYIKVPAVNITEVSSSDYPCCPISLQVIY